MHHSMHRWYLHFSKLGQLTPNYYSLPWYPNLACSSFIKDRPKKNFLSSSCLLPSLKPPLHSRWVKALIHWHVILFLSTHLTHILATQELFLVQHHLGAYKKCRIQDASQIYYIRIGIFKGELQGILCTLKLEKHLFDSTADSCKNFKCSSLHLNLEI